MPRKTVRGLSKSGSKDVHLKTPPSLSSVTDAHVNKLEVGTRRMASLIQESIHAAIQPPSTSSNGPPCRLIEWRNREKEKEAFTSNDVVCVSSASAPPDSSLHSGTLLSDEGAISAVAYENVEDFSVEQLVLTLASLYGDSESICRHLLELLSSERDTDDLQGELIDLLGFEHFDLVGKVLEMRYALVSEFNAVKESSRREPRPIITGKNGGAQPIYCQQVTVQSKLEMEMRRELRREQKRANKELNKLTHAFGEEERLELELGQRDIMRQRQLELDATPFPLFSRSVQQAVKRERYPYVFDAMVSSEGADMVIDGFKFCLPVGSKRIAHKQYEELTVPAMDNTALQNFNHVYVKDMDELGKLGFQGFEKLNAIQSLVFDQAYKSRENLLICAPTGAGKTNIAMLAILNTVHGYTVGGSIEKDDFKIIYIAPMKALATEMTETFGKRLAPLGLKVRELTGDTTLSRREIAETQMLVLTPEKWDVVTRKSASSALSKMIRLLIIDEVHLLHDDRGPVIETIVARTLRQVEMSQQGVRIVGLSATLPNYVDVARFLRVNPHKGMFFFDGRFRPVPLTQTFIGVRKPAGSTSKMAAAEMDEVCYEKVHDFAKQGHQVLVFVHARNATFKLALSFKEKAACYGHSDDFLAMANTSKDYLAAKKSLRHNPRLLELFSSGYGVHHAGLPRHDRLLIEKLFGGGHIKVLFCTSTLAWGVNLPAHAVVIRGTEVFDAEKGSFTDIGVLDVQQIFGRAGRPQFESSGHGVIITWQKNMTKYLQMLVRQAPIESQFMSRIYDNLNAEIALGTVSNINEAVEWLSYTYFFIRAKLNPVAYGIPFNQTEKDPELYEYLARMMTEAAERLDMNQMIRFDSTNGFVAATDLGRTASHFYVKYETIEMFNTGEAGVKLSSFMGDDTIAKLISMSSEFTQIKLREEETEELRELADCCCYLLLKPGQLATTAGKVYCLLQAHISRVLPSSFSLMSEVMYISQNAGRLCRAMFEIVMRRNWAKAAYACLAMAKCIDKQIWPFQTPLRQLTDFVRVEWIDKIERKKLAFHQLCDMSAKELGAMISCDGKQLYDAIHMLPMLYIDASVKPITNTIIQINVILTPDFLWIDRFLGSSVQSFWVFVEDLNENLIIHYEQVLINKKKVKAREEQHLVFTVPIRDQQISHNYQVRVASEYYVVDDSFVPISMHNCVLPAAHRPHTDLLDLDPLPVSALHNPTYESIYSFSFFNPIQTQVFHCLYKTDRNALVGAPTGSGKTLCAELAMYRVFNEQPDKKCVYVAPLKALVRERVLDWREKLEKRLNIKIVELTGDHTPDIRVLEAAKVVITTPEKWDGITRGWETREYVQKVALVIIDEIHLLGVERGAVLEAIVTRLKLMAAKRGLHSSPVRLVGLSTALANAGDVAEWLDVKDANLFNFRPNVRPVPVQVHIAGFADPHYCPRMALMNKPAFKAIKMYSPLKPSLIFVASRRQTRLTAMAFVSQLVAEDDPRQWLHMDIHELENIVQTLRDENLKLTLPFGIGLHHAGLQQHERSVVEQLFIEKKIQVLVATATLAWGVNMPAHLVIIKGTEYYDGKTQKYVDFPVTDVLQMMGRAGRPQYDDSAVAVIYVQDVKKNFYKRFLYEPFPVESSLLQVLPNHVNAEIHAGTITSKQQMMEYVANTYLYRRLFANPSYYGVAETTPEALTGFLVELVDTCVDELIESRCIAVSEEDETLFSTPLGRIGSVYYLQHITIRFLSSVMNASSSLEDLLRVLSDNPEYDEIPVRHNEDETNADLQRYLPIKLPPECAMDSSHSKAHLLFQAHFCHSRLSTDYVTDQRSVLDQCIRILQAMLDVSCLRGWLATSLNVVTLMQMIVQARWHTDHPLLVLPHLTVEHIERISPNGTIPILQSEFQVDSKRNIEEIRKIGVKRILDATILDERSATEVIDGLLHWPILEPRKCSLCTRDEVLEVNLLDEERRAKYVKVNAGADYRLRMTINSIGPNRYQTEAFCPRFPKEKSACWIAFIGEKDSGELIAVHKVPPIVGSKELRMEVRMPTNRGRHILTLFLMSDSYLGIDQEYNLHCDIV